MVEFAVDNLWNNHGAVATKSSDSCSLRKLCWGVWLMRGLSTSSRLIVVVIKLSCSSTCQREGTLTGPPVDVLIPQSRRAHRCLKRAVPWTRGAQSGA
jgi:hypothetical protein